MASFLEVVGGDGPEDTLRSARAPIPTSCRGALLSPNKADHTCTGRRGTERGSCLPVLGTCDPRADVTMSRMLVTALGCHFHLVDRGQQCPGQLLPQTVVQPRCPCAEAENPCVGGRDWQDLLSTCLVGGRGGGL